LSFSYLFVVVVGIILYLFVYKQLVVLVDMVLVFTLVLTAVDAFYMSWGYGSRFIKSSARLDEMLWPLRVEAQPEDKRPAVRFGGGHIVWDHISFGYQGRSLLFDGFSAEVEAGEHVGIVGPSGSGKSTLLYLTLGLYRPLSGVIRLDNQDLSEVSEASLWEHVTIMGQEASLLHRSIYDNLVYGTKKQDFDEVVRVCKLAAAHDFITKLPQGYHTQVGERGVLLSGGQRQRVALARALLKEAPILMLDEASSHLDTMTEVLVQEGIRALTKGKTVITVTHRLSTLQRMDRVLVIHQGVLVEQGSHHALIKQDGLYRQLWQTHDGAEHYG
jgi:ABC-type multidrug transport system fused ATPase/permease subunit